MPDFTQDPTGGQGTPPPATQSSYNPTEERKSSTGGSLSTLDKPSQGGQGEHGVGTIGDGRSSFKVSGG